MLKKRYHYEKVSLQALQKRLFKLFKAGYIDYERYQNRNSTGSTALYALNSRSIAILVEKGVPLKRIRDGLPSDYRVIHELALTDIIRAIDREGARQNYDWGFLTEKDLKRMTRGSSKGMVYPDLQMQLEFKISGEIIKRDVAVEYDNGTIKLHEVFEKVVALDRNTMILCNDSYRINKLRTAFKFFTESSDIMDIDNIMRRVFFGLLSEFCQNGFLNTHLIAVDNKRMRIL